MERLCLLKRTAENDACWTSKEACFRDVIERGTFKGKELLEEGFLRNVPGRVSGRDAGGSRKGRSCWKRAF